MTHLVLLWVPALGALGAVLCELRHIWPRRKVRAMSETTIHAAVARADFARRLAKSLLMFPLIPEQFDPNPKQFYACLETAFTVEITKMLNEEACK